MYKSWLIFGIIPIIKVGRHNYVDDIWMRHVLIADKNGSYIEYNIEKEFNVHRFSGTILLKPQIHMWVILNNSFYSDKMLSTISSHYQIMSSWSSHLEATCCHDGSENQFGLVSSTAQAL